MRIDVLTLFPEMLSSPLRGSILGRAIERGVLDVVATNIRDFALDKHHVTDDYPYGGGAGMVMKPEPMFAAAEFVLSQQRERSPQSADSRVILLSPQGRRLDQLWAAELAQQEHLVLVCGRYEGVDERIVQHLVADELSVGDFVLSGGEVAALVVIDAVCRLVPGVLSQAESTVDESHSTGLLEYPQYTRPPEFRGWKVPEVLLSGNHAVIARWRREQSLLRTLARRPDMLTSASLSKRDEEFLRRHRDNDSQGVP